MTTILHKGVPVIYYRKYDSDDPMHDPTMRHVLYPESLAQVGNISGEWRIKTVERLDSPRETYYCVLEPVDAR